MQSNTIGTRYNFFYVLCPQNIWQGWNEMKIVFFLVAKFGVSRPLNLGFIVFALL